MIIYFGNILSKHGYTPTAMETIVPKLSKYVKIYSISDKKNKIVRFLHMNYYFWKNRNDVSLLLIDVFSTKAFLFAFVIGFYSQILGIPYITVIRGGNLKYRLKKSPGLTRFLFINAAVSIIPSLFYQKRFIQNNFSIEYIPNFIEIEKYQFKHRLKLKPKLLWVRSFHKMYNPKMAIYVLNGILKDYPNACLTMVGPDKDGSQKACMDLAEELGIKKHIYFAGILTKSEWVSISEKSDIFINTTHVDNMPISIIESMALGLPIVSTNVGGIPFLIENYQNGLLVNDNDIDGMIKNIKILLNNNKLSSKLSIGARMESEKCSWEKIILDWRRVLNKYSKS
ncbi:MAG: glycosyl transferase family 1 [Candidatus Marinimicrobia bacterium]|nr:glycosyl transferase family 1 [Candidatus Neomarinimicrobiota bacterium]|tara:strand:+ start:3270 stop:4289 length:1020 start_codon:yes stop_codon:yes gene_type:complete